ncbi:hypothetical protein lerEdw1_006484 [Lerista edwardsae]|nr:hypothetical protein lerEdw1_006484 [Lerista edwardsae]
MSAIRNGTMVKEFVLLGFASVPHSKILLFTLFLTIYVVTLTGNSVIISVTTLDARLATPMYYFLRHLAVIDICYISSTVPQLLVHFLSRTQMISLLACATQNYAFFAFGDEAKRQKQGEDASGEHDDLVATSVRASQLQHGLDFTHEMIDDIMPA